MPRGRKARTGALNRMTTLTHPCDRRGRSMRQFYVAVCTAWVPPKGRQVQLPYFTSARALT